MTGADRRGGHSGTGKNFGAIDSGNSSRASWRRNVATLYRSSPLSGLNKGPSTVGAVIRQYRLDNHLTQYELATKLGFDQSYISKLETGERDIRDLPSLRRISTVLRVHPNVLGVAPEDYACDISPSTLQLVGSLVRLAMLARDSGKPDQALVELWPQVPLLEAAAESHPDNHAVLLRLADIYSAVGTIFGDLLPEEALSQSVAPLAKAWDIVEAIGDDASKSDVLRRYGNELRKAGYIDAAIERLRQAEGLSQSNMVKGSSTGFLARAYAEKGDRESFRNALIRTYRSLDKVEQFTPTFNAVSAFEIQLRGTLILGSKVEAEQILNVAEQMDSDMAVAPQWRIIIALTMKLARFLQRQADSEVTDLTVALAEAANNHLPHQIQRAIRSLRSTPRSDTSRFLISEGTRLLADLTSMENPLNRGQPGIAP